MLADIGRVFQVQHERRRMAAQPGQEIASLRPQ
jgi:hypothetical protein